MKSLALLPLFLAACSSTESSPATTAQDGSLAETASDDTSAPSDVASEAASDATPEAAVDPLAGCAKDPGPGAVTIPPSDGGADPIGGAPMFTLDMALVGFPSGSGAIKAAITTEKGVIVCTLDDKAAPFTVANFVGLARGTRPYLDKSGTWVTGHFYDGLIWHRVLPNFVIQGGDPRGNGSGGPGYEDLPVENHVAEPLGTLAMAATGPDSPSGSQFYIVVGTTSIHDYNVFGTCTTDVAIEIANVPRNKVDKPITPVHMQKIELARCP